MKKEQKLRVWHIEGLMRIRYYHQNKKLLYSLTDGIYDWNSSLRAIEDEYQLRFSKHEYQLLKKLSKKLINYDDFVIMGKGTLPEDQKTQFEADLDAFLNLESVAEEVEQVKQKLGIES